MTDLAVGQTWRLYRFRGAGELLYVGQTRQAALARLQQHLESKWWTPLVTSWDVDVQVFCSLAEVLAAEAEAIRRERPRCNDKHNRGNAGRWRSMADVPLELRPRHAAAVGQPVTRAVTPRAARPFWSGERMAVAAVVTWLGVFGAFRWLLADAKTAAITTVVAFAIAWTKTRPRRRRRR